MTHCSRTLALCVAVLFGLAISSVLPRHSTACLWDYDTIEMERNRFPGAHELIVGYFLRHSPTYYQWRIENRNAKPTDEQTPLDYDDIAVSYDKLGQHDKAIEVMLAKLERWPEERRYESEANLGTFYIHAGQYDKGLQFIKRAIEINPDAHFGREVYQKLLVEYLLESGQNGKQLPLYPKSRFAFVGFTDFVLKQRNVSRESQIAEIQAAVKGITGMMHFGNFKSPILLEALGDLFLADGLDNDSKMLAARAYLKASYEVDDAEAKKAYRGKAKTALSLQANWELERVEANLKAEIERGDELFQQISADERRWFDTKKNLDMEFANKYYNGPELLLPDQGTWATESLKRWLTTSLALFPATVLMLCLGAIAYRRVSRKRALTL